MAANTQPRFAKSGDHYMARLTTGNTNRDGTGTITDLVIGTTEGIRVDGVRFQAEVTTTAGAARIWIYDGTNWRLYKEVLVPATTISLGSVEPWSGEFVFTVPLILKGSSEKIGVTMHNSEAVLAHTLGAAEF